MKMWAPNPLLGMGPWLPWCVDKSLLGGYLRYLEKKYDIKRNMSPIFLVIFW